MNVLIVDQCSGSKSIPENSPVYSADEIDSSTLSDLLQERGTARIPARRLYTGRQQEFITEAVNVLQSADHEVDRFFISAGFGLVNSEQELPPYDVTFTSMSKSEIKERSQSLALTEDLCTLLSDSNYDIVFFPLGTDYYGAIDMKDVISSIPKNTTVVLFNQGELSASIENVVSLPARTPQAKEMGTIVVALKGRYLQNFAEHVKNEGVVRSLDDVVDYCLSEYTTQSKFTKYE